MMLFVDVELNITVAIQNYFVTNIYRPCVDARETSVGLLNT